MLEPQSRRLLLESLSTPAGHRLDWAVGTTYSLDLIALLAAPVAFAFSDSQDREGRPMLEPLALLKATRQYADRMLLFCQAGKIYVPRNYQPLLANLEGSIAEALAPGGGSFHPKVWFLRYVADDGSVTYRMLCLSRNMTFDRSWDTMLSLEGPLRDRTNAIAKNHPLGQFAESLPKMLRRDLSNVWRQRLEQLAYEIRRVEFVIPEPFEDMTYWPIGLSTSESWPFPKRLDQMLVISPFVDAGFIKDVAEYECPLQLVSRPESLAQLPSEALAPFEKLWILDETAEPETVDADVDETATATDAQAKTETALPITAESPLLGLHAKVFIADLGWNSHIWTGSANATRAAFTRNVEFLVELQGKKSRCGVAALLGQSEEQDRPHAASLSDLLKAYVAKPQEQDGTAEQKAFERLADTLAKQIASRAPVSHCDHVEGNDDYSISIRPTKPGSTLLPSGYSLRIRPISFLPDQLQDVMLLEPCWSQFERVSLLGLTSFFVWELNSSDGRFSHSFVLHIPLENAPSNRSECILRHLLSDRERVLRFLLLLLMDPDAGDFGRIAGGITDPDGKNAAVHGLFESTLLESLLRALDRRPDQIDQVEQIIRDLEQTPEGKRLLPDNLHEIWEPILEVRRRQRVAEATAR